MPMHDLLIQNQMCVVFFSSYSQPCKSLPSNAHAPAQNRSNNSDGLESPGQIRRSARVGSISVSKKMLATQRLSGTAAAALNMLACTVRPFNAAATGLKPCNSEVPCRPDLSLHSPAEGS